jgi:MSHA pilin protein MshD
MFNRSVLLGQRGVSLVELIMFIVIISVALTGILAVMNMVTRSSADPLVHKQALAIAESLLEEVELMPFTYCDPDDANAATAASSVVGAGGCAATVEAMGPEGEGRYAAPQFDNVNDYSGFPTMVAGAVLDINGGAAVNGYEANIAVAPAALSGIAGTDANGAPQALLITVTVTGPDGAPVILDGYRTRYAPRI